MQETRSPSPSPPTVLFFTYSEYGQANVNLATSYELALAGVDVHIASFAPLVNRVSHIQDLVARHASRSGGTGEPLGSITFHDCKHIIPYSERLERHNIRHATLIHPPGMSGALESYSMISAILCPWSREEYLAGIESVKETIATIHPDVVVVDNPFYLVRDACALMDQKLVVILPNSIWDIAARAQPRLAMLWKYPMTSSGFLYPLKWWQIPLNIYLCVRLAILLMNSTNLAQIRALRSSLGLGPMFDGKPSAGITHICPALPETDYPLAVIPEEVCPCGPIIMPFDPLIESDPELAAWLDNSPTVIINLGSHVISDAKFAREMGRAIRILFDSYDRKRPDRIQVLWKVKASGEIQTVIDEIVGREIRESRVKVTAWLEVEPVAILQHPNLICTIHHGGANSFYEGIWAGVPHIVLPVWLDTYDYASRVEYLGIGIYASKSSAPSVSAEELGPAMVRLTGDGDEATKFRLAAARMKDICRAKGSGRRLSALAILREVCARK